MIKPVEKQSLCLYKKTMFLLELTYIGSRYPDKPFVIPL